MREERSDDDQRNYQDEDVGDSFPLPMMPKVGKAVGFAWRLEARLGGLHLGLHLACDADLSDRFSWEVDELLVGVVD